MFGDDAITAVRKVTRWTEGYVRRVAVISERFPAEKRLPEVSWYVYQRLHPFPPKITNKLLPLAAEKNVGARRLYAMAVEMTGEDPADRTQNRTKRVAIPERKVAIYSAQGRKAMDKIDAAVRMLESQGHVVEMKIEGKTWFEIDRRMRASAEEMKNLADGVYSLSELEELFINRRVETTSAEELAEGIINEWAMYSQAGHSKDLTSDFKDLAEKAFEFQNATQILENQRSSFELIAEHTGKPVSDTALEQPSSRERLAREGFLNTYKAYLNKQRISRAAKAE